MNRIIMLMFSIALAACGGGSAPPSQPWRQRHRQRPKKPIPSRACSPARKTTAWPTTPTLLKQRRQRGRRIRDRGLRPRTNGGGGRPAYWPSTMHRTAAPAPAPNGTRCTCRPMAPTATPAPPAVRSVRSRAGPGRQRGHARAGRAGHLPGRPAHRRQRQRASAHFLCVGAQMGRQSGAAKKCAGQGGVG
ncbi:hypothetical protein LP420_40505 [Massilia sp. B-10]|nr:hypothetical protein LP420_40505 [Massilia sp. B-10]